MTPHREQRSDTTPRECRVSIKLSSGLRAEPEGVRARDAYRDGRPATHLMGKYMCLDREYIHSRTNEDVLFGPQNEMAEKGRCQP